MPPTPTGPPSESVTDGRLLRGQRTRRLVLRAAVDVASVDGLDGVTFGRMSTATGQSKAGVQTLFGSKEALQLATAEFAGTLFAEHIEQPALAATEGLARLRDLIDRWLDYVNAPLFVGGCFWTATLPEFDSKPGAVRDLLFAQRKKWLALLEAQARRAIDLGEIAEQDPRLLAFQLDAVMQATNIDLRREPRGALRRGRAAINHLLGD